MNETIMRATSVKRLAKIWLISAIILACCWLFIWLSVKDKTVAVHTVTDVEPRTIKDLTLPKKVEALGDLAPEVPEVNFEVIKRDLRNYPNEFKDKEFFERNKDKWTVQVMDVSEHQLITDYLDSRKDRKKFAYFRYMDVNNKERYILTYGVMSSFQEAMGAANLIPFKLANSTRVLPEKIDRYFGMIDSYSRPDEVEELQSAPPVKLKETKNELKAQPASEAEVAKPKQDSGASAEPIVQTQQAPKLAVPPTAKPTKEAKANTVSPPPSESEVEFKPEPRIEPKPEPKPEPRIEPPPEAVVSLEPEASIPVPAEGGD